MNNPIRIATVYKKDLFEQFVPSDMSLIRWLKISEALADKGFKVDMIVNAKSGLLQKNWNLRYVSYSLVDWSRYDIVKTLFHEGFDSLQSAGGDNHPFIVSKLGSVVGNHDGSEGVHFFNDERKELFETQKQINLKSKYITILTEPSKRLWEMEFGKKTNILLVPTGVDKTIPPPSQNPYGQSGDKIVVYLGNLYVSTQKEINLLWQTKLNRLGNLLRKKRINLFLIGPGNIDRLDRGAVTYLGPVDNQRIWDYQYFADVGIALAQGKVQHNESSKIYYYLRTGLPVVSETPIPNNHLIQEADLGFIADYADDQMMAEMIESAVYKRWDREHAIQYMFSNHTWGQKSGDLHQADKRRVRRRNGQPQAEKTTNCFEKKDIG
jgi:hypothetical protein